MNRCIACLLLAFMLTACATPEPEAPPPPAPPEPVVSVAAPEPKVEAPPPEQPSTKQGANSLAQGLKAYGNGQYKTARKLLRSALDSGLSKTDQVAAHKHLAFVACAGGQKEICKNHFREAMAIDPDFDLNRTEAGHPVWGKVFRALKSERQKKGS
jgi:Tfp pilus assembly protein PilF